ncbi:sperm axonemal maintenance protein CFAP97D1 [Scophthalmus maximus]|uniref:sperm axonemal maintenance protein CFAP97D1 n=1 Tax=Scophthalmus maximus TaxID=52904 RepID=UPI001FA82973|nr:sperm axonemal maintenance protein CFAP97D1 [Scophthalmus maximus]XP_035459613.2 sperm axonemal maintenance protein CFAP97D1 [Scophthalmus maximus]XP_035459614.2 sperm axonemal maintenance protein CFAP97D1 [Scophthalmus maximus]
MMQHLLYPPLFPAANKSLQHKFDKSAYDLHRMKVKSAKPTIDMTPPRTYNHLSLNVTRKPAMDRALQIQRENDMLRDKLSHIMRTTGGLDNWNYYDKKSLDKERRRSELLRITTENQMILSRLSQVRPNYNVKSWHDDWLRTLRLRDSIARFPRGRENLQKGEEKQDKSNSGCDKKQKMNTDATPARAKVKTESEGNEKKKGTNKQAETSSRSRESDGQRAR